MNLIGWVSCQSGWSCAHPGPSIDLPLLLTGLKIKLYSWFGLVLCSLYDCIEFHDFIFYKRRSLFSSFHWLLYPVQCIHWSCYQQCAYNDVLSKIKHLCQNTEPTRFVTMCRILKCTSIYVFLN